MSIRGRTRRGASRPILAGVQDDVICLGTEARLWDCSAQKPRGTNNCRHKGAYSVTGKLLEGTLRVCLHEIPAATILAKRAPRNAPLAEILSPTPLGPAEDVAVACFSELCVGCQASWSHAMGCSCASVRHPALSPSHKCAPLISQRQGRLLPLRHRSHLPSRMHLVSRKATAHPP